MNRWRKVFDETTHRKLITVLPLIVSVLLLRGFAYCPAILPIRTFSNGPTNSMRGAAFLAGLDGPERRERDSNAQGLGTSWIVVDIGGTTTDVGVLLPSGFPRKAAAFTLGIFSYNIFRIH